MDNFPQATHYQLEDMPKERVSDVLERRLISGDKLMLAYVYLKQGCLVPLHEHEHEQMTYVLSGALRFRIGAEDGEEIIVRAGEVLHTPSHVPHMAEALEDTVGLDAFSPPRQDWLDKSDDYLRQK